MSLRTGILQVLERVGDLRWMDVVASGQMVAAHADHHDVVFYCVLHKRIWIRAEPSTTAATIGGLVQHDIVGVSAVVAEHWAQLAEEELNFLQTKPAAAFVLIDGTILGLPTLLRELPSGDACIPPRELWRLPHELLRRSADDPVLPPQRTKAFDGAEWPHATCAEDYLCYWRAAEDRERAGSTGWHGRVASDDLRAALAAIDGGDAGRSTRLATATLIRGASARSAANFVLYHRAVGFERVYLYFDAPHEDIDAMAAAAAIEGAVVVECTDAFWRAQRTSNPFFTRAEGGADDVCSPSQFDAGDVQSRQCAAVQDAMSRARAGGFEWLIHLDSDELWYSPLAAVQQRGAALFFEAVHPAVAQVSFHNHEAVPPRPSESHSATNAAPADTDAGPPTSADADADADAPTSADADANADASASADADADASAHADGCPFETVQLFKPHEAFTRSSAQNEKRALASAGRDHARRFARDDPARASTDQSASSDGRGSTEEDDKAISGWLSRHLDDPFDASLRSIHLMRTNHHLIRSKDDPLLSAQIRARKESVDKRRAHAEGATARREVRRLMRATGRADDARRADAESDASDDESRAAELRANEEAALEFRYFHAHDQGKAAVRLFPHTPGVRTPEAGIHRSGSVPGDTHVAEGPGAPVILHYPACSLAAFTRKYRMLTTHPRFQGAKQASLGELPQSAHTRSSHGGIPSAGAPANTPVGAPKLHDPERLFAVHTMAARLVRAGDAAAARRVYEQTICMADMLPLLASKGLLLRIDSPRQLIERVRRQRAAAAAAAVAVRPAAAPRPAEGSGACELSCPGAGAPSAPSAAKGRGSIGRRLRSRLEGAVADRGELVEVS